MFLFFRQLTTTRNHLILDYIKESKIYTKSSKTECHNKQIALNNTRIMYKTEENFLNEDLDYDVEDCELLTSKDYVHLGEWE